MRAVRCLTAVRCLIVLSLAATCAVLLAAGAAVAGVQTLQPNFSTGVEFDPLAGVLAHARPAFVPGDLLVEYRAGASGVLRRGVSGAGGTITRRLLGSAAGAGRALVLVHSATLTTAQLAARLKADPAVTRVSPNYLRYPSGSPVNVPPDDPRLARQWGLGDIGAGDAWQMTTGAADVVIASIDTGVDVLHPDLAANMWHNPGEIPGNNIDDDHNGYVDDVYGIDVVNHDSIPMDDYGHGTHTSGIMAAVGDNGVGVAGVGWHTQVMALKFLSAYNGGTDADAIICIDYVIGEKVDHGVNVVAINASWGGAASDLFLRNAINRAGAADIVFCAAAGNDENDNDQYSMYPASFDCPNILSVAATTPDDRLAWFSDWGQVTVDLAAPGDGIVSTLPDGNYASWSGTSMATPFVAGTVALCAAVHPGETALQRIDRIMRTVRREPWLTRECVSGGRLDAAAAVRGAPPATDTQAPVTTALGADTRAHDVPVTVDLLATDGPGGSGVAATRWRVDGGAWQARTTAVVPAPLKTRRTARLEYYSRDYAGNASPVQSLTITTDTRARALDNELPGVPLPPSPVVGGLDVDGDRVDVYRLTLNAGQTFRATLSGRSNSGIAVDFVGPGAKVSQRPILATWLPEEQPVFACRAATTGSYSLVVRHNDLSEGHPQAYVIVYDIVAPGVDVVPPTVNVLGYLHVWHNDTQILPLVATDGPGGSGVAACETSSDDGFTWTPATAVDVEAPADHTNDGRHSVLFRARDVAGNVSQASRREVLIDTRGPTTRAWAPTTAVRRGAKARVRFQTEDLTERVHCVVVVASATTGRVVLIKRLGWRPTVAAVWWMSDFKDGCLIDCRFPAGTYTVRVAGSTCDEAGNRFATATCERLLTVN